MWLGSIARNIRGYRWLYEDLYRCGLHMYLLRGCSVIPFLFRIDQDCVRAIRCHGRSGMWPAGAWLPAMQPLAPPRMHLRAILCAVMGQLEH